MPSDLGGRTYTYASRRPSCPQMLGLDSFFADSVFSILRQLQSCLASHISTLESASRRSMQSGSALGFMLQSRGLLLESRYLFERNARSILETIKNELG
jgi:hypothetical protein